MTVTQGATIIGASARSSKVEQLAQKVGNSRVPVLLLGESGTGKEVVAKTIHNVKSQGAFVPIDCGALPSTLVESELFGHEKGAFTGAFGARPGLLQRAHGGTAFFDEIGELPLEAQAKLLRALQQQEIRPVGSDNTRPCVFRIIAATNRDLTTEVKHKRFRLDLYYRINVVSVELPPLRQRKVDIPLLFNHFLRRAESGKKPQPGLIDVLLDYGWPGNIRELENCVARLIALATDEWLLVEDLPFAITALSPSGFVNVPSEALDSTDSGSTPAVCEPRSWLDVAPISFTMDDAERSAIKRALAAAAGNHGAAAKALGIGRTTLYRKLKKLETD